MKTTTTNPLTKTTQEVTTASSTAITTTTTKTFTPTTFTVGIRHALAGLIFPGLMQVTFGTYAYCFTTSPRLVGKISEHLMALYGTHNGAARQRGLVQENEEDHIAFQEAINFSTPRELRILLVTLIIAGAPAASLWDFHRDALSAEFQLTMSISSAYDRALRQIDLMLSKHGKTTLPVGLPHVQHNNSEYDRLLSSFDKDEMLQQATTSSPS